MSIALTLTVIANVAFRTPVSGDSTAWITCSPLAPLSVRLLTGRWLFALPYVGKSRAVPRT